MSYEPTEQINREPSPTSPWAQWVRSWIDRYRIGRDRATSSRWPIPVIAVLVLAGIVWSWQRLDLSFDTLRFGPLLGSLLLAIPAALLSALEYSLAQRIVGSRATLSQSVNVSLFGSLANLLPLPGGAMVRVEAMTSTGSRLSAAVRTTAGVGIIWVALAMIASGSAITVLDRPVIGLVLVAAGLVAMVAGIIAIGPRDRRTKWLTVAVIALELTVIGVATCRILLVLHAIGEDATWTQALGLVSAGAVAVAAGIVPAGLGIRELLAGLLAPLVGLTAAAGFITAGINQILTLVGQSLLALVTMMRRD